MLPTTKSKNRYEMFDFIQEEGELQLEGITFSN